MGDSIQDAETMSEEPLSIDPEEEVAAEQLVQEMDSTLTVDIIHHNGTASVSDFERIVEINVEMKTIRVWYDEDNREYEDYHGATIVGVNP